MYLKNYKTIVVKIGSSLLIDSKKKVRKRWLDKFALDIKHLINLYSFFIPVVMCYLYDFVFLKRESYLLN